MITKICQTCLKEYKTYDKRRKFCSTKCYGLSEANINKLKNMSLLPRKPRKKKPSSDKLRKCKICGIDFPSKSNTSYCFEHKKEARLAQGGRGRKGKSTGEIRSCPICNFEFYNFPSVKKKYCSYKCHLESGGAKRAGLAGAGMMKKYGAKKDANHIEIVNAFKALGADVMDLSTQGCGIPDLVVWCKGNWHLVDIKNPKTGYGRRGLNERQKEWALAWKGGPVYLISTIEQAADMVNGKFDCLKKFPE